MSPYFPDTSSPNPLYAKAAEVLPRLDEENVVRFAKEILDYYILQGHAFAHDGIDCQYYYRGRRCAIGRMLPLSLAKDLRGYYVSVTYLLDQRFSRDEQRAYEALQTLHDSLALAKHREAVMFEVLRIWAVDLEDSTYPLARLVYQTALAWAKEPENEKAFQKRFTY